MNVKIKRTYNLPARTVERVRELRDKAVAPTQDGVVELAVDLVYDELRDREEAAWWETAAADSEFQAEMAAVAEDFGPAETWPR